MVISASLLVWGSGHFAGTILVPTMRFGSSNEETLLCSGKVILVSKMKFLYQRSSRSCIAEADGGLVDFPVGDPPLQCDGDAAPVSLAGDAWRS